jgi:catecholate siderophore receptor
MTRKSVLNGTASQAAMMAGLAMTFPGVALAQTTAPVTTGTVTLPTVDVQGAAPANTLQRQAPVSRLPGTVQDTPQVINVIPREVLEQQNVTTLEQALRNVPGITSSIGEGNGGVNGDQLRIRGFNAQNDIYVDGLRDFGTYQRDAFTYEDVSVIKGPSGFALGTGSVGGGVAVNTRMPHLGNSYGATATGGMGPYARGTVDINQQIGETTAIRLNLMGQRSETVDRDDVDQKKWGIAPSIAFGLGTDTTLSLHYMHYEYDNATDAGVPVVTRPGNRIARPITEYGVPRSTWYGISSERDEVTADMFTARLSHQFNDWLTVANDTRLAFVDRDFAYGVASCSAGTVATGNLGRGCLDNFFANPRRTANVALSGAGNPYHQETWAIQNITTATAKFTTGPLRHELVGGFDVSYENIDRTGYGYVGSRPTDTSVFGGFGDVSLARGARANQRETSTTAYAAFLNERLWLTPELSLIAGGRVTRYEVEHDAGATPVTATSEIHIDKSVTVFDPRASVVWEPAPSSTFYATYSSSSTPPGAYFATQNSTVGNFRDNLDPERNTLYEVGAKVGFFENRLGVYASLYRITKDNAVETGVDLEPVQTSDKQRNQGIEIGITGQVTPEWNINANYTYMDSEIRRSTTAANKGNRVQFVPENSASVWTTYDINKGQPWNLTVGGGVVWRDKVYLNPANTAEAPSNLSFDAVISHKINDNLRVQVNGYNLGDALNYDALFGSRVIPAAGRTVLLTLAADF